MCDPEYELRQEVERLREQVGQVREERDDLERRVIGYEDGAEAIDTLIDVATEFAVQHAEIASSPCRCDLCGAVRGLQLTSSDDSGVSDESSGDLAVAPI